MIYGVHCEFCAVATSCLFPANIGRNAINIYLAKLKTRYKIGEASAAHTVQGYDQWLQWR